MPDALIPVRADLAHAWRTCALADREQVERCREVADPIDFYAPRRRRLVAAMRFAARTIWRNRA